MRARAHSPRSRHGRRNCDLSDKLVGLEHFAVVRRKNDDGVGREGAFKGTAIDRVHDSPELGVQLIHTDTDPMDPSVFPDRRQHLCTQAKTGK